MNDVQKVRDVFLTLGIDIHNPLSLKRLQRVEIEAPVRIGAFEPQIEFSIGAFSYIHDGIYSRVRIGRYCSIGRNLVCLQPNHPTDWVSTHPFQYMEIDKIISPNALINVDSGKEGSDFFRLEKPSPKSKGIHIGNDVWIGTNVTILNGVTIGDGAIVGAGSVVTKNVAPYSIVAGNPARVLKMRFSKSDQRLHSDYLNRLR